MPSNGGEGISTSDPRFSKNSREIRERLKVVPLLLYCMFKRQLGGETDSLVCVDAKLNIEGGKYIAGRIRRTLDCSLQLIRTSFHMCPLPPSQKRW